MPVLEPLIAARGFISFPGGFCQSVLRRYSDGCVQFCSLGAIYASTGQFSEASRPVIAALAAAIQSSEMKILGLMEPNDWTDDANAVISYNNSHTQAEVVAMFDLAIEIERARTRDLAGILLTPALPLSTEPELASCP